MIVIVNYGMGNLRSVEKAFSFLGHAVKVSDEPSLLEEAEGIVLPGVGAFGDAVAELRKRGFFQALRDAVGSGKPLLGICLGYQLLFEESEESPGVKGLGLVPGRVVRFPSRVKVPHMGWNLARFVRLHPVWEGMEGRNFFYFVHSYYPVVEDENAVLAVTEYGGEFASAASSGNVVAFQFHPEKSSSAGLRLLDNFAKGCRKEG
jgi:glutamine amidotransferase